MGIKDPTRGDLARPCAGRRSGSDYSSGSSAARNTALAQIFANVLDEVRDERNKGRDSDRPYDNDGVWLYLKAGLETAGGAHFVHEWLPGDALSDLKTVREGRCEECRSEEYDDG